MGFFPPPCPSHFFRRRWYLAFYKGKNNLTSHPTRLPHHHHHHHQVLALLLACARKNCHHPLWNHMDPVNEEEILVLLLLPVWCPACLQKVRTHLLILVRVFRAAEEQELPMLPIVQRQLQLMFANTYRRAVKCCSNCKTKKHCHRISVFSVSKSNYSKQIRMTSMELPK